MQRLFIMPRKKPSRGAGFISVMISHFPPFLCEIRMVATAFRHAVSDPLHAVSQADNTLGSLLTGTDFAVIEQIFAADGNG